MDSYAKPEAPLRRVVIVGDVRPADTTNQIVIGVVTMLIVHFLLTPGKRR